MRDRYWIVMVSFYRCAWRRTFPTGEDIVVSSKVHQEAMVEQLLQIKGIEQNKLIE
jgi:hypothetical protein